MYACNRRRMGWFVFYLLYFDGELECMYWLLFKYAAAIPGLSFVLPLGNNFRYRPSSPPHVKVGLVSAVTAGYRLQSMPLTSHTSVRSASKGRAVAGQNGFI